MPVPTATPSPSQFNGPVLPIAALNAAYWSKALAFTDVLDCMPQKRRDDWKNLDTHDLRRLMGYVSQVLAAAGGNANATQHRADIAKHMTAEQIEEAQALSRAWKPGMALPTSSRTGGDA